MKPGAIIMRTAGVPGDAPAPLPGETPWFSGDQRPVQIGVYKLRIPHLGGSKRTKAKKDSKCEERLRSEGRGGLTTRKSSANKDSLRSMLIKT